MNLEEYQNKILELSDELNNLKLEKANMEKQLEDKGKEYDELKSASDKRIAELQEHNQKLFLRVGQVVEDYKEEKKDEFVSKVMGGYEKYLSEDELNILKDIEGSI